MCGVVGFDGVNFNTRLEILKKLEIRGRDGFGYWGLDGAKQYQKKTQTGVVEYLDKQQMFEKQMLSATILIANTRAIPTTEFQSGAGFDIRNQQPFSEQQYAVVFNGLLANDKELIKQFGLYPSATVDTAILCPLFNIAGVVEGMKMLDGAFSIVAVDKINKKIYFGKNFMPMCFVLENDTLIVTSLKEMLPQHLQAKAKEVLPYTCYEYDTKSHKIVQIHSLYRKERNKKVMVICSGGTDSVTTAYVYKHLGYDVTLTHFNYGQAAQEVEQFAVENIAKDLGAKLVVYDAKPIFGLFKEASKLLHQKEADPNQQMLDAESTLSYVPNRNAIFAMIIGGLAEKEGCDTVAFGGQQMDSVYPDNTPDFVKSIDEVLKYSLNWQSNVKFSAPLIHLIKHEIVKIGLGLSVPFHYVCSCYYPKLVDDNIVVCGKCGCCQFRFSAFKMLGYKDKQQYETLPHRYWFDDCKEEYDVGKQFTSDFINKYVRPFV